MIRIVLFAYKLHVSLPLAHLKAAPCRDDSHRTKSAISRTVRSTSRLQWIYTMWRLYESCFRSWKRTKYSSCTRAIKLSFPPARSFLLKDASLTKVSCGLTIICRCGCPIILVHILFRYARVSRTRIVLFLLRLHVTRRWLSSDPCSVRFPPQIRISVASPNDNPFDTMVLLL